MTPAFSPVSASPSRLSPRAKSARGDMRRSLRRDPNQWSATRATQATAHCPLGRRSAGHHLLDGEDAILDQAAYPVIGDAELAGGLGHRHPFAGLLGRAVGVNAIHPPH